MKKRMAENTFLAAKLKTLLLFFLFFYLVSFLRRQTLGRFSFHNTERLQGPETHDEDELNLSLS